MKEHVKNILILLVIVFFGCIISGIASYQNKLSSGPSLNQVYAETERKTEQDKIEQAQLDVFYSQQMNKHFQGELRNKGEAYVEFARLNNIHPCVLSAISIHETGNGTSLAIRKLNNPGGIMVSSGKYLQKFNTFGVNKDNTDGLWYMASTLRKYYIEEGKVTLEQIQKKYCPIGVANDPTGLNKFWLTGVTKWYNTLKGEDVK